MSFCGMNSSLMIYFVITTLFILVGSYIFRKIWCMDSYTKILESKVINLKKKNSELQHLLESPEDMSFEDADILMQGIFNLDEKEIQKTNESQEKPVTCSNIPIDNDVELQIDISTHLPVSEHNTIDIPDKDTVEIESVISESIQSVQGIYNRNKLSKFNVDKLKEICLSMDLSTEGTKNIIIERILAQ